ncbi:hypothetical protein GQ457_05G023030 [Hibiscus cannabinus]
MNLGREEAGTANKKSRTSVKVAGGRGSGDRTRGEVRAWEHQRSLESVRGDGGRWISCVARSGAWKTKGRTEHRNGTRGGTEVVSSDRSGTVRSGQIQRSRLGSANEIERIRVLVLLGSGFCIWTLYIFIWACIYF